MGGRKPREMLPGLARARERFQVWRRTRERRSPIPEPLWALAVELAGAHGVHRTASVLKLNYYSLKKRVELAEDRDGSKSPAFIELPPATLGGRECVIEFEDGMGIGLRVHLRGYEATDVVAVACSLRGTQ